MASVKNSVLALLVATMAACSASTPKVPYPAYMQSSEIPDSFLAELPGTRAKILTTNVSSRTYSMLLQLPADYEFSTGGAPDRSLEMYVLQGSVSIGEFDLDEGGYVYLPSGTFGTAMRSDGGALLLYFIDSVSPDAVIETPIISDSDLLSWSMQSDSIEQFGLATKELRSDPGSGATTWLLKIEPGAILPWQQTEADQEGYMISGQYRHSECVQGIPVTGDYTPGGYFNRPVGAIHGGPDSAALTTSVWLMRTQGKPTVTSNLVCDLSDGR